jgi:hypothetical protein
MPAGTHIFSDAFVSINAVDLSDHVKSATLTYGADAQEDTAMGDTTKSNASGLKDWTIEVEFYQDYSAAKVDATLFPLVGGAAVAFELRDNKTQAVAVDNPKFTGTGIVESYQPVGGGVGEMAMTSCTLRPGGATPTLTRATA